MLWHVTRSSLVDMIVELHVAGTPEHHQVEAGLIPPASCNLFQEYAGGLLWLRLARLLPDSSPDTAAAHLRSMGDRAFIAALLLLDTAHPVLRLLHLMRVLPLQWLVGQMNDDWLAKDFLSLLKDPQAIRETLADTFLRYGRWSRTSYESLQQPNELEDYLPLNRVNNVLRTTIPSARRITIFISPLLSPHVYGDVWGQELVVVVGRAHSTPSFMAVAAMHEALHHSPLLPAVAREMLATPPSSDASQASRVAAKRGVTAFEQQPHEDLAIALSVALGIRLNILNERDVTRFLDSPAQYSLLARHLEDWPQVLQHMCLPDVTRRTSSARENALRQPAETSRNSEGPRRSF